MNTSDSSSLTIFLLDFTTVPFELLDSTLVHNRRKYWKFIVKFLQPKKLTTQYTLFFIFSTDTQTIESSAGIKSFHEVKKKGVSKRMFSAIETSSFINYNRSRKTPE